MPNMEKPWGERQLYTKICYCEINPANIYLLIVNNRNTRKTCDICSKVKNKNTSMVQKKVREHKRIE